MSVSQLEQNGALSTLANDGNLMKHFRNSSKSSLSAGESITAGEYS